MSDEERVPGDPLYVDIPAPTVQHLTVISAAEYEALRASLARAEAVVEAAREHRHWYPDTDHEGDCPDDSVSDKCKCAQKWHRRMADALAALDAADEKETG